MNDRNEKGRSGAAKGIAHYNTKLTEAQAIEIKKLVSYRNLDQWTIASMYGISNQAVSCISTGQSWRHI